MTSKFEISFDFDKDSNHAKLPADIKDSKRQEILNKMTRYLSEEKDTENFRDIVQDDLACMVTVSNTEEAFTTYSGGDSMPLDEIIKNEGNDELLCKIIGKDFTDSFWDHIVPKLAKEFENGGAKRQLDEMVKEYTELLKEDLKEKGEIDLLKILEEKA